MDENGRPLIESILDVGEQKGTGRWTLEDAIDRGIYIPTIYEAVFARSFSSNKEIRVVGSKKLSNSGIPLVMEDFETKLCNALLAGVISSYAQGMALIAKASKDNGWNINMSDLASVWRGGCIIRSVLLSEVKKSLVENKDNLLLSDTFAYITELEPALREVVTKVNSSAIAVPALASVLNYYDYFRMEQMPVNFVQALRDCFGAHTYRRIDKEGYFHTKW
jgi:6-phosphogluconate dehydrogenase